MIFVFAFLWFLWFLVLTLTPEVFGLVIVENTLVGDGESEDPSVRVLPTHTSGRNAVILAHNRANSKMTSRLLVLAIVLDLETVMI